MSTYFDWLDDYMDNALSAEQHLEFEKAMLDDEKLRHAVENYPLLKQLSASLIEDETRQMLNELQNKKSSGSHTRSLWSWLAAAVLIGLLAYIGKSLFFTSPGKDQILVDLYIKPVSNPTRGGVKDSIDLKKAIDLFDRNYLTEALPLFKQPPVNDSLQTIAHRYLAHIYLRTDQLPLADSLFTTIQQAPSYRNEALYHRMVIALLQNKKEEANLLFNLLDKSQFSAAQLAKVEGYLR